MITDCISTTSFVVLIKDEAINEFSAGRGIGQGDLLSPLLFNLVVENFSQTMDVAKLNKEIDTYVIGESLVGKQLMIVN